MRLRLSCPLTVTVPRNRLSPVGQRVQGRKGWKENWASAFSPGLKSLRENRPLCRPFGTRFAEILPGTPVPGYRLSRPFGTDCVGRPAGLFHGACKPRTQWGEFSSELSKLAD